MKLSSPSMQTSAYRVDIRQEIKEVYYSRHRELLREFVSLRDFESMFLDQEIEEIDSQLNRYFHRGYNYLSGQEVDGFVDFTFDDENIQFNHVSASEVSRYLIQNAFAHLYAHIVLWLMDNTDIEDHLSSSYHLANMSMYYMTFSYRR